MEADYVAKGNLARIHEVSDDGSHLSLIFQNSVIVNVAISPKGAFKKGDSVFVEEDNVLIDAPEGLWNDPTWVAIVRLATPDTTILDRNGVLIQVAKSSVEYTEGNTVEATETSGVIRVLSEKSISRFDAPTVDSALIDRFKTTPSQLASETFADFGGYQEAVARARDLIELPLERHDQLNAIGARPIKGVLFAGPPGTGKTKLARIIAARAGATFYYVSGSEVFAPLVGQSEEILRAVFHDARQQARAIIFFDELDSLAADREVSSHESSTRVVAQLLTLIDGFTADDNLIVIGATNRPQDIDPALRRPGRLDWEVHFGYPTEQERLDILLRSAKHLSTDGSLPLEEIAARTASWSPAELAAIWTEAARLAATDDRYTIIAEDCYAGFKRIMRQRRVKNS